MNENEAIRDHLDACRAVETKIWLMAGQGIH